MNTYTMTPTIVYTTFRTLEIKAPKRIHLRLGSGTFYLEGGPELGEFRLGKNNPGFFGEDIF